MLSWLTHIPKNVWLLRGSSRLLVHSTEYVLLLLGWLLWLSQIAKEVRLLLLGWLWVAGLVSGCVCVES